MPYSLKNSFLDDFNEEVYKGWAETPIYATETEKFIFKKYLKNNCLETIEAGTGGGRISFYLEEEMGFRNIIAYDLVPKLIERCQLKAKEKNSKIKFVLADVSNLKRYEPGQFDNILYTGQVLSMVPKKYLDDALIEARKIGHDTSTYIFSFMDWNSRWFNPILSFAINSVRILKFQKPNKYCIPEVRHNGSFNKSFFNKSQHSIYWVKKKHISKRIEDAGFIIKSHYAEKEFGKVPRGAAIFFVCTKSINN